MSTQPAFEPVCSGTDGAVTLRIAPRPRDLGGFTVRRVLPAPERRMVGPFIFFDEMGPAVFPPGEGIEVRPHPHIAIATITYLFDGEEYGTGLMAVFRTGAPVELVAAADTRLMLIGGEPVGERTIWWNFVSSSKERIEQAKRDWREGRFGRIEGDDEFIPLPDSA